MLQEAGRKLSTTRCYKVTGNDEQNLSLRLYHADPLPLVASHNSPSSAYCWKTHSSDHSHKTYSVHTVLGGRELTGRHFRDIDPPEYTMLEQQGLSERDACLLIRNIDVLHDPL